MSTAKSTADRMAERRALRRRNGSKPRRAEEMRSRSERGRFMPPESPDQPTEFYSDKEDE